MYQQSYQQANHNYETDLQLEKFFQPWKHYTLTQNFQI